MARTCADQRGGTRRCNGLQSARLQEIQLTFNAGCSRPRAGAPFSFGDPDHFAMAGLCIPLYFKRRCEPRKASYPGADAVARWKAMATAARPRERECPDGPA